MGNELASYERDDPGFIEDLRSSREAVARATGLLSRWGFPVVVRPIFERPKVEDMAQYSDGGDLEILERVEVKRRVSLTFTSLEDYPYETVIVDVCHAYDRARPKPYMHMIFNRDMTACLLVGRKTRGHWIRTTKLDRFKGRERHFYECPLEHVICKRDLPKA